MTTRARLRALRQMAAKDSKPAEPTPLKKAIDFVALVKSDPIEAANQLKQLENAMRGSHALIQVLARRLGGGPIEIARNEWMALPPNEHLTVEVVPDGNARIILTYDDGPVT